MYKSRVQKKIRTNDKLRAVIIVNISTSNGKDEIDYFRDNGTDKFYEKPGVFHRFININESV